MSGRQNKIEKIKQSIPKYCFFEEIFEDSGFAPKILAEIELNYATNQQGNLFNSSPVLKKDQEVHLFRKLNYLKYRLIKNTRGFEKSEDYPSPKPKKSTNLDRIGEKKILELESLISRIQEVRNSILQSNIKLIARPISRYFKIDTFDREEFISNGYLHVLKAIDAYDYRRGFKFSTYCVNALQTNLYRDHKMLARNQSKLEDDKFEVETKDFSTLYLIETEYTETVIDRVFGFLKKKKKEKYIDVLKMSYGIGCDKLLQQDIASKLGLSKGRVKQIKEKAFEMIQDFVSENKI